MKEFEQLGTLDDNFEIEENQGDAEKRYEKMLGELALSLEHLGTTYENFEIAENQGDAGKRYEKMLGEIAFSLEHWYPGVFTRKSFNYSTNTMHLEWKIPMTTEVLSMVQENAPYILKKLTVKEDHNYIHWRNLMDLLGYLYHGPRLKNGQYFTDFFEVAKYQALKEMADTIDHVRKSMIYSKLDMLEQEVSSEILRKSLENLILPW